jgi:cell division protein FtsZ
MGYGLAEGEDRALKAVEEALSSPLLNDNNIKGASQVLLYITSGIKEITMDEVGEISDYIQEEAGSTANIIFGISFDEELGDSVRAIVIATGFSQKKDFGIELQKQEKKRFNLEETPVTNVTVVTPVVESKIEPVAEEKTETPQEDFMYVKKIVAEEPKQEEPTEPQFSMEFVIPKDSSQKIVHVLDDFNEEPVKEEKSFVEPVQAEVRKPEVEAKQEEIFTDKPSVEEQMQKAKEKLNRLKEMNFKTLVRPDTLTGMENEPAYKRRNIQLENLPHSSESQVSRYTLSENEEKKTEIRPNNSFLHDNVD